MHSPGLKEATKACLRACCSPPMPEPEQHPTEVKRRSTSAACRHNFASAATAGLFPNTSFTNHESIPSLQESFVQFIKAYPKYSDTAPVDQIRAKEYGHLSLSNHISLDYIGVGLFSQSQVKPQDSSVPSDAAVQPDCPLFSITFRSVSLKAQLLHGGDGSELESVIRKRIMDFLNISQTDYSMVFTANRSSAFKLVAESYPFQSSRKLLTVYDHAGEAVDALTSMSEKRNARVMAAEFKWPRLRIYSPKLRSMIVGKKTKKARGLFVFPLQSRMTGTSYSYQWMALAQEHGWHVLLDACALGPKVMASFGLSLFCPDFLICSFYKVFGQNPTGFGCLFVKKSVVPILETSSGAGIVSIVTAKDMLQFPDDSSGTDMELEQIAKLGIKQGADASTSKEDKASYLHEKESGLAEPEKRIVLIQDMQMENENAGSIIQCRCLDHVDSLGLNLINSRGRYLINWLITALMKLQHPNRLNNFPLVTIYGPKVKFERGPALAFNIYDWKGEKVEPVLVQKLADRGNISVGHGFLRHIWFPVKCKEAKQNVLERNTEATRIDGRKAGGDDQGIAVVTAALTFLADFEDVYRLWAFVAQFLDADFVEKERWRYTALNQKTVEV